MSSKARGLADLGNAYDDGALSNRNLIINGGMTVSQRGDYTSATVSTNNQYYLDRWKLARTGVSGTITHTGSWQRLEATSSASGTYRARQAFEIQDISRFAGKTVTMSARVKSNSSNARILISADGWLSGSGNSVHSGNGQEETLTLTVTLPSSISTSSTADVGFDGALSANVSIQSGDYVEFTEVQLEVGDTATPFEHRSFGDELARCQRYFERLGNNVEAYAIVTSFSTSVTYGDFRFSPKRANPTISISGPASNYRVRSAGNNFILDSLDFSNTDATGFSRVNCVSSGFTVGYAGWLSRNDNDTYIDVDAEL